MLNFPDPNVQSEYRADGKVWKWDGQKWRSTTSFYVMPDLPTGSPYYMPFKTRNSGTIDLPILRT